MSDAGIVIGLVAAIVVIAALAARVSEQRGRR